MRIPHLSRNVALFLLASALIDVGVFGIMDVLLNFFYRSIDFNLEAISVLQGAQRIGGLLFSLPAGLLIARLGARRTLIIAAVIIALALVGMTIGSDFGWQYGVRALLGAGYSTVYIAMIPMVATLVGREQYTTVFSYQFIAVALAVAITNSIGGSLPGALASLFPTLGGAESTGAYAGSLWVAAVFPLLCLIPLALLPDTKAPVTTPAQARIGVPWGNILIISLPMFIFGLSAGMSLPYYNLFFRDTFALSDAMIGNIFTLGAVAMLAITLIVPYTARRVGQVSALALAMFATGAAFLLLSLTPGIELTVVFYMLALGLRNTMTPLYSPLLLDRVDERHHGLISSVSTGAWSLGFLVITFFSGGWVQQFGYPFLFQLTALTTLVTGALALVIFRALRPVVQEVKVVVQPGGV
ncbi:MAG: MFS transporter [Chloroflexota bacterium]|nr:MFS transporter [Chloroflexota bacterium]